LSSTEGLLWLVACVAAVYAAAYFLPRSGRAARLGLRVEGLAVVVRSSRLAAQLESFGRSHRRALRLVGDASVVAGAALGALGLAFLHYNLLQLLTKSPVASPVVPLVPGWTVGIDALPFFAAAVLVALFPHEFMHALVAAAEGVPVKSAGAFLLLLFPGGFVELDESALPQLSARAQARVFAAGSAANALVFLLAVVAASTLVYPAGVRVAGTLPGAPASSVLAPGDVIVEVSGVPTRTVSEFVAALSSHKPGEQVWVVVLRGSRVVNLSVTLASRPGEPGRPMLGVYLQQAFNNEALYSLLWWIMLVSGSVALLNMLPLYPLDGGRLFALAMGFAEPLRRRARSATVIVSAYTGALLAANVALSLGAQPLP